MQSLPNILGWSVSENRVQELETEVQYDGTVRPSMREPGDFGAEYTLEFEGTFSRNLNPPQEFIDHPLWQTSTSSIVPAKPRVLVIFYGYSNDYYCHTTEQFPFQI